MPPPSLETLPAEILEQICQYLHGRHKKDLGAFSLANKACHSHAVAVLYSTLRFQPLVTDRIALTSAISRNSQQLIELVAVYKTILDRYSAHRYVKCVKVEECWEEEEARKASDPPPLFSSVPEPTHFDLLDSDDEFADLDACSLLKYSKLKYDESTPEKNNAFWQPLADLIETLPTLLDLFFDNTWPFPPCLLRVIQLPHSGFRLHLGEFSFRDSLCQKQDDLRQEDKTPQELPLLLSPRLQGIRTRSSGFCWNTAEDYTHEAIFALIKSLNPALKQVSLLMPGRNTNPYIGDPIGDRWPRSPWSGFDITNRNESQRQAKLNSFEMGGISTVRLDTLEAWLQSCDVSTLTTLKLRMATTHLGLRYLATKANFKNLSTLVLGIKSPTDLGPELGTEDISSDFLDSLPPLISLRFVSNISDDTLQSVLKRHGPSLRRLWFAPPDEDRKYQAYGFLCPSQILSLTQACTSLEDLSLTVPRSVGDSTEVAMYQGLGGLPKLHTLAIALDCEDIVLDLNNELPQDWDQSEEELDTNQTPIYPYFDDFDTEFSETYFRSGYRTWRRPRKGHVRMAMMNMALDENLACQIFRTISNAKPLTNGVIPLARLELRPVGGQYDTDANSTIRHMGKWWLLENDGLEGLGYKIKASRLRSPGDYDDESYGPGLDLDPETQSIFRRIWPGDRGMERKWSMDWHGLPLDI